MRLFTIIWLSAMGIAIEKVVDKYTGSTDKVLPLHPFVAILLLVGILVAVCQDFKELGG